MFVSAVVFRPQKFHYNFASPGMISNHLNLHANLQGVSYGMEHQRGIGQRLKIAIVPSPFVMVTQSVPFLHHFHIIFAIVWHGRTRVGCYMPRTVTVRP